MVGHFPSDEELASSVTQTAYWRRNRRFMTPQRSWELPMHVRASLCEKGYDKRLFQLEFEKLVQRVTHIRRSRSSKNGQAKRRKTLLRKKQYELFE